MTKTHDNDKSVGSKLAKASSESSAAMISFAKVVQKVARKLDWMTQLGRSSGSFHYGRKGRLNKNQVFNGCKALQVGPGRHHRRTQNHQMKNKQQRIMGRTLKGGLNRSSF